MFVMAAKIRDLQIVMSSCDERTLRFGSFHAFLHRLKFDCVKVTFLKRTCFVQVFKTYKSKVGQSLNGVEALDLALG